MHRIPRSRSPLAALCAALALPLLACSGDDPSSSASAGEGSGEASSSSSSSGEVSTSGAATTTGGSASSASGTSGTSGTSGDATTSGTSGGHDTSSTGDTGVVDGFLVGVDVADVSPSDAQIGKKDIYMGAYGAPYTRGPAQGVHDAIYVRSFAIEGPGGGVIMAISDFPGMGNKLTRAIRTKVAELTGLEEHRVLIGTTHTHSSPDLMGLWGGVPGSYRDQVIDAASASMAAAWAARTPADLYVATGKAPNNNRRGWGFTDDDMIVIDAVDLEGGRIGTLVNFAAHPVVLGEDNKEVSCDYTGYTIDALEAELGAPAALFNGTLGDATPKVPDGDYADDFERAAAYGELLAGFAVDLVDGGEPIDPAVHVDHRAWVQGVDNVLFKLAGQLGILEYDFDIQGLDQKVETQSTYLRLGTQVQLVAFPGESLTRNGLAIKEAMSAPHRMILGNTGDALGYFVPSDEWQTGKNDNYEESVSLGMSAGDTARDIIVGMIGVDAF